MKRVLLASLLLMTIAVAGCIFGDDDKDDDKNDGGGNTIVQGYQAAEYLPLGLGLCWDYERIYQYSDGSTSPYDHTVTVLASTIDFDGHQYRMLLDEMGAWTDTSYVAIRDNVYWSYEEPLIVRVSKPVIGTAPSVPEKPAAAEESIFPADHMPLYRFDQEEWGVYSETAVDGDHTFFSGMTGAFEGVEDVTVPAGEYRDCLKFHFTNTYTVTWTGDGEMEPYTRINHRYVYLAKDTGPVKVLEQYVTNGSTTGSSVTETLASFTTLKD